LLLLLLLLRILLAIGRGRSQDYPPCWIVSRAAPVCNAVVKEGCDFTKTSENLGIVKGLKPKCRRRALTILNDAISDRRA
jgi:hypothetical protein